MTKKVQAHQLARRIAGLKTFTSHKTGKECVDIFVDTDLRDLIVMALAAYGNDRAAAMEAIARGEYSEMSLLGDSRRTSTPIPHDGETP